MTKKEAKEKIEEMLLKFVEEFSLKIAFLHDECFAIIDIIDISDPKFKPGDQVTDGHSIFVVESIDEFSGYGYRLKQTNSNIICFSNETELELYRNPEPIK